MVEILNGNKLPTAPRKRDRIIFSDSENLLERFLEEVPLDYSKEWETFLANATFFYEQREIIYSDSRLFFTPVPIEFSFLSMEKYYPLGAFLEWWEHGIYGSAGEGRLIYDATFLSDEVVVAKCVDCEGVISEISVEESMALEDERAQYLYRYGSLSACIETYRITEVQEILSEGMTLPEIDQSGWTSFAYSLFETIQSKERRIESLNQKIRATRILWRQEQILAFHAEKEKRLALLEEEIERVKAAKREVKKRYPKWERGSAFSKEIQALNREEQELRSSVDRDLDRLMVKSWPFFSRDTHCMMTFEEIPTRDEVMRVTNEHNLERIVSELTTEDLGDLQTVQNVAQIGNNDDQNELFVMRDDGDDPPPLPYLGQVDEGCTLPHPYPI